MSNDITVNREALTEIYEARMCGGAGCCGDFDGALDAATLAAAKVLEDFAAGSLDLDIARKILGAM